MGWSVGFVQCQLDEPNPEAKRAALENELDAWAQLCREGPALDLYEFVLPIDDQLYWFVNRRDPVAHDQFRRLPENRILKDCPSTDPSDDVLIGRIGSWYTLAKEIISAEAKHDALLVYPEDPFNLIYYWAPSEFSTCTLYFHRSPYLRPKSWQIHPNTAYRIKYDFAYNAIAWPDFFANWRKSFGSVDEGWLKHLAFVRQWLRSHKLLFGTKYDTVGIDKTDLPPLHPVPKLRLDPSGTKALPLCSE